MGFAARKSSFYNGFLNDSDDVIAIKLVGKMDTLAFADKAVKKYAKDITKIGVCFSRGVQRSVSKTSETNQPR
jgi:hypothetical protein